MDEDKIAEIVESLEKTRPENYEFLLIYNLFERHSLKRRFIRLAGRLVRFLLPTQIVNKVVSLKLVQRVIR
jgi:hypothetical protein